MGYVMTPPEARVLIIDDEPDVAAMLVDSIEFLGYRVRAAHNGLDGTRMVEEFHPHVVLLDYLMPQMDGRHVLQFLKALYPSLPVVILSGTQDESVARALLNDGAWDFVPKPVDLGYLARVLAAATAGTAERPQAERERRAS
jgi:two-component system OmpR family response regulator